MKLLTVLVSCNFCLLIVFGAICYTTCDEVSYDVGVDFVTSLTKAVDDDAASAATTVRVGIDASGSRYRALLAFNLESVSEQLRAKSLAGYGCARIKRASLLFYVHSKQLRASASFDPSLNEKHADAMPTQPTPFRLYASDVMLPWDRESVDWMYRHRSGNTSRWNVPFLKANGLDARYPAYSFLNIALQPERSEHSVDVTESVQRWLADSSTNHGLLLWLWQDLLFMKVQWRKMRPSALLTIASKGSANELERPRLRIQIEGKTQS